MSKYLSVCRATLRASIRMIARRPILRGSVLVVVFASLALPSYSQEGRDPLFERVLRNPGDVETNLRYARASVGRGDFEAAISALERLLIGRDGLPLIRLELGILYLRIGAPELAEAYIRQAIAHPDMSATGRKRGEALLSTVQRQNRRGKLSGHLTVSGKYQSNANAAPIAEDFREAFAARYPHINPDTLEIPPETQAQADSANATNLSLAYSYELAGLRRNAINAGLNIYASQQNERRDLDAQYASLRLGVTLETYGNWVIAPYATLDNLTISDYDNYATTSAVGLSLSKALWRTTPLTLSLETANRTHTNFATSPTPQTAAIPDNDDKDGARHKARLSLGRVFATQSRLSSYLRYERVEAQTRALQSTTSAFGLSYFFGTRYPLRLQYALTLDLAQKREDATRINNDHPREDNDATLSLSISGYLARKTSLALNLSAIDRRSNISDAQFQDETATLSLTRSF